MFGGQVGLLLLLNLFGFDIEYKFFFEFSQVEILILCFSMYGSRIVIIVLSHMFLMAVFREKGVCPKIHANSS